MLLQMARFLFFFCNGWRCLFSFLKNNFIYLFLTDPGFYGCTGFSLVVVSGGSSLVSVHGLLIAGVSLVSECEL